MEITAYDSTKQNAEPVLLGSPIAEYWVNGFRSGQRRSIQVSKPIGAVIPNLFDRITNEDTDAFAAERAFTGPAAQGDALKFYRTHKNNVPRLAHIQFTADGQTIWQRDCAIIEVQLVKLTAARVGFSYTIIGGRASLE